MSRMLGSMAESMFSRLSREPGEGHTSWWGRVLGQYTATFFIGGRGTVSSSRDVLSLNFSRIFEGGFLTDATGWLDSTRVGSGGHVGGTLLKFHEIPWASGPIRQQVAWAGKFLVSTSCPDGGSWWLTMTLGSPSFLLTEGAYSTMGLAQRAAEEEVPKWLRTIVLANMEIEETGIELPGGVMSYRGRFGELKLSIPSEHSERYLLELSYGERSYTWTFSAEFSKETHDLVRAVKEMLGWLASDSLSALTSLGLPVPGLPKGALERVCGEEWF